jgi:hypothetical protein
MIGQEERAGGAESFVFSCCLAALDFWMEKTMDGVFGCCCCYLSSRRTKAKGGIDDVFS